MILWKNFGLVFAFKKLCLLACSDTCRVRRKYFGQKTEQSVASNFFVSCKVGVENLNRFSLLKTETMLFQCYSLSCRLLLRQNNLKFSNDFLRALHFTVCK